MNIHLITIGSRMPDWVSKGYDEYARRMPRECSLRLIELAPGHRGKNANIDKAITEEGERIKAAIPKGTHLIALDERGKSLSTKQLSEQMKGWLQQGEDITLLVGGPDGLSAECLQLARSRWSLSPLTLPHPLVRIVVAEQLYRAWSILQGHPYHRE